MILQIYKTKRILKNKNITVEIKNTVVSPAGEAALPPPPTRYPKRSVEKARSWALSIGVPTNKLRNMQTSEFIQKFRHSWGITENYFETIQ